MKSPKTKLALSTFVIVAILTSPAFAKKPERSTYKNTSLVYGSPVYGAIPGYDTEGNVVAIDPDQPGSRRR